MLETKTLWLDHRESRGAFRYEITRNEIMHRTVGHIEGFKFYPIKGKAH